MPPDILYILFDLIRTLGSIDFPTYDEEKCRGASLLSLSQTCRYMRQQTLPFIFREVYNWPGEGRTGDIWPESVRPYFVEVYLRDHTIRHPRRPMTLSIAVFQALQTMPALTRVTVRVAERLPGALLQALSSVPSLRSLKIYEARWDGPTLPTPLLFPALESLSISIYGFDGMLPRANDIDLSLETANVTTVLNAVSQTLRTLRVSGDLLNPDSFSLLSWPSLYTLTITEHPPISYISLQHLLGHMPKLEELSALFSADLSRQDQKMMRRPFPYGQPGGAVLERKSPRLRSITLSNLEAEDPIFDQLPADLVTLKLVAGTSPVRPLSGRHRPQRRFHEAPLRYNDVLFVLSRISPDLIAAVASACPRLRMLELGHVWYPRGNIDLLDPLDEAFIPPLANLKNLTHLSLSLDFDIRESQVDAARWFMSRLVTLQTIAFQYEQWRYWRTHGLDEVGWETHDRSVLNH
ncbi:hypothetical protein B0H10DRAFT_2246476 [Mycena sp. CBHHK59/15]|nr:hypothetical protein B0H10DRAFT_2246476 [Mycena sp. CBHHK59/15]